MTERAARRYQDLDLWPLEEVLEALYEAQLRALSALKGALPALKEAVLAAAMRLEKGGVLAYAGAGTSGRLAVLDGVELWPTFGFGRVRFLLAGGLEALREAQEGAEDRYEEGLTQGEQLGPGDVLVAVAASGQTPYTLGVLRGARAKGALTVAFANNPGTPLLLEAHHPVLLDTGPEPIAGSTRLGAGTAQKVALNLFSTALMVRMGRVYGNRMLRMRATNRKLKERAARTLRELFGLREEDALALLERTEDPALALLLALGMEEEGARALLEKGVRAALKEVGR